MIKLIHDSYLARCLLQGIKWCNNIISEMSVCNYRDTAYFRSTEGVQCYTQQIQRDAFFRNRLQHPTHLVKCIVQGYNATHNTLSKMPSSWLECYTQHILRDAHLRNIMLHITHLAWSPCLKYSAIHTTHVASQTRYAYPNGHVQHVIRHGWLHLLEVQRCS